MSNIFKTAEVMRLISSREDRFMEAKKVLDCITEETGPDAEPKEVIQAFLFNVADLIANVENRCYSQMWDEANDIPQFDPDIEPKDCFHCKRMVKLRGEFCYGHLQMYESSEPPAH